MKVSLICMSIKEYCVLGSIQSKWYSSVDKFCVVQALEHRTKESRHEMDVLDALEELKDLNARNAHGMCSVYIPS